MTESLTVAPAGGLDGIELTRKAINEAPETKTVDFVVFSHGRTGAGAHTSQGIAHRRGCGSPGTDGDDAENCDNDASFISSDFFSTVAGVNHFDDKIVHTLNFNGVCDDGEARIPDPTNANAPPICRPIFPCNDDEIHAGYDTTTGDALCIAISDLAVNEFKGVTCNSGDIIGGFDADGAPFCVANQGGANKGSACHPDTALPCPCGGTRIGGQRKCDGSCVGCQRDSNRQSCFKAGTLVTMADGSKKTIETVSVGDELLGIDGAANTVIELDHSQYFYERVMIAINDGEDFISDNHPLKTTKGWAAYNVEMAEREAFDQLAGKIKQLEIGDVLITQTGEIEITSIKTSLLPPGERLYNFWLDGNHTYYANGILNHSYVPDKAGLYSVAKPQTELGLLR